MPDQSTFPGVYIEEKKNTVRTIEGVPTSVTAFVGRAQKGPVNEPVVIHNFVEYESTFGGLWTYSTMGFCVRDFFVNGGAVAVIVRVHNGAKPAEISIPIGRSTRDKLVLIAASRGLWGNKLTATVDYPVATDPTDPTLFNIVIEEKGGLTEKYFDVSLDPLKKDYLPLVLAQQSKLMHVKKNGNRYIIPSPRRSHSRVSQVGALTSDGSDGDHITDTELFSGLNVQANREGLYALEKTDLFNLLCIPPYAAADFSQPPIDKKATDVTTALIAEANTYCIKRRALLLIDSHSSWTTAAAAKNGFLSTYPAIVSNHAAIFFPRLKQRDILMKKKKEELIASGAVAGVFARTDAKRGVWKAPAGREATLVGVEEFSVALTDTDNGPLNQLGINSLRTFPVYGPVVWGSRTLEGADQHASEWKYIPVRRLGLYIEESLHRGLKWIVFEPNDEPLWAKIRLTVGTFLHTLFRQGAFQGATPKEAYFVKCDRQTMTQNDIDLGVVNIRVGFAPLKPAEFVIITIQQIAKHTTC